MNRYIITIILLSVSLLINSEGSIAQDDKAFLSLGIKHSIKSDILSESRDIIVGLPKGYENSEDNYPVAYLLDGPSHFHHTTGTTRFLAQNRRMPDVIVVAISNTDRTRDLTPPNYVDSTGSYPTAGGADNFLKFIKNELMPYVNDNYRTRAYSILIGHSFGGLLANHALVHHSHLFDAYISISPSLWWDDQRLVSQADSAFKHMDELVGDFYMTMGNEGDAMLGGALKFAGVLEEKAPQSFRWEFKLMEEEDHGSVPLRSTYYGFEKIFDGWNLHDPSALYQTGGLLAIDRHFERISERYGYQRSVTGRMLKQIGDEALESNNGSDALEVFSRMVKQSPNSVSALLGVAKSYAMLGNKEEAIKNFQFVLRIDPKNKNAREKLAEYEVDLSAYTAVIEVPIDLLKSYVGKYERQDEEFMIILEEQTLSVKRYGQKYELSALSNDRFKLVVADIYLNFIPDESGSISKIEVDQDGDKWEAIRIE